MTVLSYLKRLYLALKGYTYNKKYRWFVHAETCTAFSNNISLWQWCKGHYKGQCKGQYISHRLGSWTFYSSNRCNQDVLDTLRDTFAIKTTNVGKELTITVNGRKI